MSCIALRVLLLSVPLPGGKISGEISPPLGLAYIASFLESKGVEVNLVDAHALNFNLNMIKNLFLQERPNIIGVSVTTAQVTLAFSLAEIAKMILPNVFFIVGGAHPSLLPYDLLSNENIDACVIGEGETTLFEIVKALEEGKNLERIKGITFRGHHGPIFSGVRPPIENLDALPFPAWHKLPIEKYTSPINRRHPYANIVASRGCPYNCIFCGVGRILGKNQRKRTPKNVVDEIQYLVESFHVKEIFVRDSTFTFDPKWATRIADEIRQRELDILWQCETRANLVNQKLLKRMKASGCYAIWYGVESGNNKILKRMKKGITTDQVREAFKITKAAGIRTHAFFIFGMPDETKETMRQTIDFAIELDPDIASFNVATPFPGTELYEIASKESMLSDDWSEYMVKLYRGADTSIAYSPSGLSREEIVTAYSEAHKRFYCRPRFVARQLMNVRNTDDIRFVLRGFRTFLRYWLK